ncbi:MAG: DNA polymerase III subunit gamma/tau [Deltaproteobacteria bacterium]|nr:DNA polymerase III subunit gamma/tau [Deltaproteobacteria bacterium]
MEYRVLSRKWRPQSFADVIGQDHVVKTLGNAIRQNRIAHAFIFSGPRGIGKTSIARIMAKAVNCIEGPTDVPCNQCASCREITDGISIDVHEIDGASNRGIDEIRELRENVKFSPVSSRYKVYIIDEVHMLTREAFNALLKTLEEPPSHVIFIFATTETHKIPSTILSRCQCFDFKRISLREIGENLRRICESEKIGISEAGLMWIAQAADGSARDAQSILDQVISYAENNAVSDEDIEALLGLTDRKFLFTFSEAVIERNAARCLTSVEDAYYAGVDMKFFYQMLLNHFRNLLLLKILGDSRGVLELTGDESGAMKKQITKCTRHTLQQYLDILMDEEENIRRSLNPRLNLEAVLVRMAYLEPVVPIDHILLRIEDIERKLSANTPLSHKTLTNKVEEPPGEIFFTGREEKMNEINKEKRTGQSENHVPEENGIEENPSARASYEYRPESFHRDFLNFAKEKNSRLSSKIEPGKLTYEQGCLTIAFPVGYIFADNIKQPAQQDGLAAIAKAFFGKEVIVKIESMTQEDDHEKRGNNGNQKNSDRKREALQGPLLQKILDVFTESEVREVQEKKAVKKDIKE